MKKTTTMLSKTTGRRATMVTVLSLIMLLCSAVVKANVPQPTITSVSPSVGYPATTVTITGTNFNTTTTNNIVYFGATRATVNTATATQLTVTVPTGATFMPVSVDNIATNLSGYQDNFFLPTYNNSAYIAGMINFDNEVAFSTGTDAPWAVTFGDFDGDGKPDMAVSGGFTSSSVYVFLNTSTSGSITSGSFAAPIILACQSWPSFLKAGDIDGDGKLDIVVANRTSNSVSIFRNTSTPGSLSFATQVIILTSPPGTGINPSAIAIADYDHDGKADIAVSVQNTHPSLNVYRNTSSPGSLSFATAVVLPYTLSGSPQTMTAADLDGDGKADLMANDQVGGHVDIFHNTSSGPGSISFAAGFTISSGGTPFGVAAVDIDGDNKPEIVTSNSSGLVVFHNISTSGTLNSGSFGAPVTFASGSSIVEITAGDIDGDGKVDIVAANAASNLVSVFRNTSTLGSITTGSLASHVDFQAGNIAGGARGLAVGDLDGDGKADIVVSDPTNKGIMILRNDPLSPISGNTAVIMCSGSGTTTLSDEAQNGVWSSANTTVATVNTSGVVTGVAGGTAVISYTVLYGAATATVTVTGQPTVTNVSPLVGYPASAVTITGTNFNTTTTNDIVYFGATRATVTTATATTLNVTVPTGATYRDVSVDNAGCALTGYSELPFLQNYNNSAYIPGTVNVDPMVTFPASGNPQSVSIGDLDGDGKPDLVIVSSNGALVYRNTSSSGSITAGSFSGPVTFTLPYGCQYGAIGDIDGDGKPDLVVTNSNNNTVSVFFNTSTSGSITAGSFAVPVAFSTGNGSEIVAIGDIDGDGRPDLAIANYSNNTISVLRNTGSVGSITSSSFAPQVTFAVGSNPYSIAIGDIDGDGMPDLVANNNGDNTVSVLRNTGSSGNITAGSFAPQVTFTTDTRPFYVAIADIDGDGKPDLVTANFDANDVSVLRNTSSSGSITSSSFAPQVTFAVGGGPIALAVGDIDGDGKPDVAVANLGDNTFSVLRNTSTSGSITTGSFTQQVVIATGGLPYFVAVGDFDADGKADIVTANYGDGDMSVFHNDPMQPLAPQIVTICGGTTTSLSDATPNGVWSSSNTTIATVSTHGYVTGVGGGTTIISYILSGGPLTATVTVNAAPTIHTFTGGGAYCAGDTGVHVGLTLSDPGISYQLYNGSTAVVIKAGTGGDIDFGLFTTPGVYHAIATNTVTLCTTYLSGITISINPLPGTFTVTGGGSFCASGAGVHVGLNGSATGINYQLYNGSSPAGGTMAGTGSSLDFGLQTASGVYTVIGSNVITFCPQAMAGTATVTAIPLPTAETMTGGGAYCAFDTGVHVGLNTTTAGIQYQLYRGGSPVGAAHTGSGATLDFGLQTVAGVYTAIATNTTTSCTAMMTGSVTVTANPLPDTFAITGGGSYCAGGTGVHVRLSGSHTGIRYQLYKGAAAAGSPLNGTGGTLDFGLITAAGVYKVVATDTTTHCINAKKDSAVVSINPVVVPTLNISTGVGDGDTVCLGTPITFTAQTHNGGTTPHYQWMLNNTNVGTNDSTYTHTPAGEDLVGVVMISSATCAMPDTLFDTIRIQTQIPLPPSVFIMASPLTSLFIGQPDTLTAVPMNCGPSPVYQWFNNVSAITGATNAMYISNGFTNHDSISVKVVSSGVCGGRVTENSVIITVYPAGVAQVTGSSNVRLFPNPNEGSFRISGTLGSTYDGEVSVEIMDMLGQAIYKSTVIARNGVINEQIQLSNTLANGMYLLNLRAANESDVFHFVVGR